MTKSEFFLTYSPQYEDISATLDYTAGVSVDLLKGQPIIVLEDGNAVNVFIQSIDLDSKTVFYYNPMDHKAGYKAYQNDWVFMKLFKKGSIYEGIKPGHVKSSSCECGAEATYGVGCNKNFHSFWCKSDKVYKR